MDTIPTSIEEMFPQLSEQERRRILMKALTAGAMELKQKTVSLFKERVPGASNEMLQGVRLKKNNAYTEVDVHIMGEYKNKWFEKGTAARKTKKGYNRGRIEGKYFFRDARQDTTSVENKVMDSIKNSLDR